MNNRIKVLSDYLKQQRLDALVLDEMSQIQYLLEIYKTFPPGEVNGVMLVTPDDLLLIAPPLTSYRLSPLPGEVTLVKADVGAYVRNKHLYTGEIGKLLKSRRVRHVGVFSQRYLRTMPSAISFKLLNKNPLLELAETKTEHELKLLELATAIADAVFRQIIGELRPGLSEIQAKARLDELIYQSGAVSFGGLVSFGENTSWVHAISTTRSLRRGDMVMIDFCARIDGMESDLTRTFVFGKANREQRSLWKAVYDSQQAALKKMHAGVQGKDVALAAYDRMAKAGYGDCYYHTLGHQLGLLKGETRLNPFCARKLLANMVLTVEPGAYLPFGGVRLEDDVVVTASGIRMLTHSPKPMETA